MPKPPDDDTPEIRLHEPPEEGEGEETLLGEVEVEPDGDEPDGFPLDSFLSVVDRIQGIADAEYGLRTERMSALAETLMVLRHYLPRSHEEEWKSDEERAIPSAIANKARRAVGLCLDELIRLQKSEQDEPQHPAWRQSLLAIGNGAYDLVVRKAGEADA